MKIIILLAVALLVSSIGFKKYVYFFSVGYGFAITALAITLMIMFKGNLNIGTILMGILLIVYGIRLGGYLAYREIKSVNYKKLLNKEVKTNDQVPLFVRSMIWIACGLLYVLMMYPYYLRLLHNVSFNIGGIIGFIMMICGVLLEWIADMQKNNAKKKNPHRFVDTGVYKFVRCPNYLGELILWTGLLVTGISCFTGALEVILALVGWIGIVFVMFSGARRLELRQNHNYGKDVEYQHYVHTVPIILPFIPLYSVEKYTFLVA